MEIYFNSEFHILQESLDLNKVMVNNIILPKK